MRWRLAFLILWAKTAWRTYQAVALLERAARKMARNQKGTFRASGEVTVPFKVPHDGPPVHPNDDAVPFEVGKKGVFLWPKRK